MNAISWAEVVGSVRVPLTIAAAVFVTLIVVAIVRTRGSRRRLADKRPPQAR